MRRTMHCTRTHAHCMRTARALHAHLYMRMHMCMHMHMHTTARQMHGMCVQGTRLYLGTVPRSAAHLAELHSLGVRAVVTLNQAWEPQIAGGVPKVTLTP